MLQIVQYFTHHLYGLCDIRTDGSSFNDTTEILTIQKKKRVNPRMIMAYETKDISDHKQIS